MKGNMIVSVFDTDKRILLTPIYPTMYVQMNIHIGLSTRPTSILCMDLQSKNEMTEYRNGELTKWLVSISWSESCLRYILVYIVWSEVYIHLYKDESKN